MSAKSTTAGERKETPQVFSPSLRLASASPSSSPSLWLSTCVGLASYLGTEVGCRRGIELEKLSKTTQKKEVSRKCFDFRAVIGGF